MTPFLRIEPGQVLPSPLKACILLVPELHSVRQGMLCRNPSRVIKIYGLNLTAEEILEVWKQFCDVYNFAPTGPEFNHFRHLATTKTCSYCGLMGEVLHRLVCMKPTQYGRTRQAEFFTRAANLIMSQGFLEGAAQLRCFPR